MKTDPRPALDVLESISDIDAAGWGDAKRLLTCPVCGFDYTHVDPPYLKDGDDNYQAGWGGRGDLVVVPLWSECGSKWELCLGFHKGQTAVFTRLVETCKSPPSASDT